jgi:glycosyltransferase involved in cell wall biosynthesis
MQLSVIIPCLNEIDTIERCINKCFSSFQSLKLENQAEVIVADNGSTDGSIEAAKKAGAKVINIKKKGYGNAIIGGVEHSSGKYIVMGDADDSYDFSKLEDFYLKLNEGFDIVQGCRFPNGGGSIEKSAMPLSHKYFGNPLFSSISKFFFSLPFNDVYCGYRGFRRDIFKKLNHFSGGMVFAIENLIKFKVYGAKCTEIPVTLHRDGRKKTKSHLNTISDGWKTLRFLLVTCPKWIYFFPSLILLFFSSFSFFEFLFLTTISDTKIVYSYLIEAIIYFLLSFQIFMFGLFASLFAVKLKLLNSSFINLFFKIFKLRYAFYLAFISIFLFYITFNFRDEIGINSITIEILKHSLTLFSVLLILNSLYISLITLDQNSNK